MKQLRGRHGCGVLAKIGQVVDLAKVMLVNYIKRPFSYIRPRRLVLSAYKDTVDIINDCIFFI